MTRGRTFRYFTYDDFGRLRQIKNHGSIVIQAFGYTYGLPSFVSDTVYLSQSPVKRVVTNTYVDGLGRPIQTVTHDGTNYTVAAIQYDGDGREWRKWKPFTRSTAGYDASFTTNATSFYNTYLGVANAKPYVETLYKPDPLGRVSRVFPEYAGSTPSDTTVTSYGTDTASKQTYVEMIDPLGKKTRSYRNAFGNEVKSILGYGAAEVTTTVLGYNVLGHRTQVTDPRGLISRDSFDTRGLLRKRTMPDAGTVQRKYDKAGNLRFSQDANQAAAGKVHFTKYDFANRPLTSGVGTATFSLLDPDAAPTALETTNSSWVNVWAYDAKPANVVPWSHFWTQISPLTLSNVNGRLAAEATRSNGAWQVTLYSYDTDGRVVKRYTFTQNNAGSAVLTAVNTTDSSTYDLKGNRTFRVLTVGSNTWRQWYDYDGAGRLWKVFSSTGSSKPATPDVTYTYRPSGAIDSRTLLGGPSVPFRYTIREELARIGDPATTTYPFSARYSYHRNGTVNEAEFYSAGSSAAQKRYRYVMGTSAYDALNRLTSADFSPWSGSAWTSTTAHDLSNIGYDASGNLTSFRRYRETTSLIDNLTYTIPGSSNKLSSISEAAGSSSETWDAEAGSFTYDANGNILTTPAPYSITATTYDHRNQPTSITRAGTTTTYRYNGGGWRIAKQVGSGNTEIYIQDGPVTLAVFTLNSSGTATSWYFNILAGDKVVGRQPNTGSKSYYHTDLLGSTRAVVQGATVTESYDYDPYGMLMPGRTLAGSTKEGFTGKERDSETGLDYFGQRLYMPAFGRWSTVDPVADSFPQWTPFNYVEGNPVTYTDPFGLNPCLVPPVAAVCWTVVTAAVGMLATSNPGFAESAEAAGSFMLDNAATALAVGGYLIYNGLRNLLPNVLNAWDATTDDGIYKTPETHPGDFTRLKGNQGYRAPDGTIWRPDRLHKDHWDVNNKRGNKVREVSNDGRQIWPDGPKNKNKEN